MRTSVAEDARCRDFTINAIYIDVASMKFVDPLNGLQHLKARTLNCVADPLTVFEASSDRFLRLGRFIASGFKPTSDLAEFVKAYFIEERFKLVNMQPKKAAMQLDKIFSSKDCGLVLKALHDIGVSPWLWCELGHYDTFARKANTLFAMLEIVEAVLFNEKFAALARNFLTSALPYDRVCANVKKACVAYVLGDGKCYEHLKLRSVQPLFEIHDINDTCLKNVLFFNMYKHFYNSIELYDPQSPYGLVGIIPIANKLVQHTIIGSAFSVEAIVSMVEHKLTTDNLFFQEN